MTNYNTKNRNTIDSNYTIELHIYHSNLKLLETSAVIGLMSIYMIPLIVYRKQFHSVDDDLLP
ncbi:MAG: hypothetical protein HVN34_06205 [Methanobacteriaceae archaeon]|nr:hypothetical protein [Methanobacteriaceae archaeon]